MQIGRTILIAIGLAATAASASAQTNSATAAADSAGPGLLGKNYVEAGLAYFDPHAGKFGYGAGFDVNSALTSYADLTFTGTYTRWRGGRGSGKTLDLGLTGYLTSGTLKPFAGVSLGHAWQRSYNEWMWGAQVGVEFAATDRLALRVSAGYDDDFNGKAKAGWSTRGKLNYWFTDTVAGTADLVLGEGGNRGFGLGVAVKF